MERLSLWAATKNVLRPIRDYWRWRRSRPALPRGDVKLHLGCGQVLLDGYINIDTFPYPGAHLVRNVTSSRLWSLHSVDLIYTSHVLEHIPRADVPRVLAQWRKFLKPTGILRISVPDFGVLHRVYSERGQLNEIAPPLMGGQYNRYDFHYSIFDRVSLEELLFEAGFASVRMWNPAKVFPEGARDCSGATIRLGGKEQYLSLNLEAINQ